jgi:hypothetical protein
MISGGTISDGSGNGIGAGKSIGGTGIVICAGKTDASTAAVLSLGANRPPTLSGLSAGHRGCFSGSQSALSRPLSRIWRASAVNSSEDGSAFDSFGGSGIWRSSAAICA